VVAGRRRDRGVGLSLLGAAAAALLVFPVVADVLGRPGAVLSSFVGTDDPWSVLRLAPGAGPGTWALAAFLPVAALLCFAAVDPEQRGRAWRAMAVGVAGTVLAWTSAAGYLPEALSNPPVYLAAAALAEAAVIAYGASGLVADLQRQAFGFRQLGAALLTIVLSVGIGAQALQVTLAEWEVRPGGLPPAWPVVDSSAPGDFRILWIGAPRGDRFPAPGGDPIGVLEAAGASVRYGLTDRHGASALDVGRPDVGAGYDRLRVALGELLAGRTSHAGALLGPLGVRFVVAGDGDVPAGALERLDAQADLDRVPAGGLILYRNAAELPTAFVAADARWTPSTEASDAAEIAARPIVPVARVAPPEAGPSPIETAGELVVLDQFEGAWRVETGGREVAPARAFGWAISAEVAAGTVGLRYTDQWVRTLEMIALALLWLAALWVTRKPGSA
jgi:hypothetical protein